MELFVNISFDVFLLQVRLLPRQSACTAGNSYPNPLHYCTRQVRVETRLHAKVNGTKFLLCVCSSLATNRARSYLALRSSSIHLISSENIAREAREVMVQVVVLFTIALLEYQGLSRWLSHNDKGLTLEISALKLSTVTHLRCQLS